ncbi:MAG TPA: hypothetical protein DIU35_15545 [Candidatus Latescibacteria bacterium]|nr:hypothetical protein [Candidatus Latescibacterota bacterium]|tara:strand:- start:2033 stop:2758 length:726 start_codon:yes stop_codon:yes gene_type:complete
MRVGGDVLYVSVAMFVAATLQGVTGFGFMLLALPVLVVGFPAQIVVPALFMSWIPLGTIQHIQFRYQVDWRILIWFAVPGLVGLPLGVYILSNTDTLTMQRGIGILMVCLAVLLQLRPGAPFKRETSTIFGVGLISGILAGSTAVSGPPIVLLGLKQRWDFRRFRATLLTYFLVLSLVGLPFHYQAGLLDAASLSLALSGLPGLVAGFLMGAFLREHIASDAFRWIAVGMVLVGGLVAVFL